MLENKIFNKEIDGVNIEIKADYIEGLNKEAILTIVFPENELRSKGMTLNQSFDYEVMSRISEIPLDQFGGGSNGIKIIEVTGETWEEIDETIEKYINSLSISKFPKYRNF